ncbi:MAG: helix-turn-helix transcriptional regulator [Janthinobacterium lividum]
MEPLGGCGGSSPLRTPSERGGSSPSASCRSVRRWYLVGYDLDRADWRPFRVDRTSGAEGTGVPFGPRRPPFDDVAVSVLAGVQAAEARGSGNHGVEAVVEAPVAEVVAGSAARRGSRPARRRPAPFRIETDDLGRAVLALGDGGAVRVVGPPELVDRVRAQADRFAVAAGVAPETTG